MALSCSYIIDFGRVPVTLSLPPNLKQDSFLCFDNLTVDLRVQLFEREIEVLSFREGIAI